MAAASSTASAKTAERPPATPAAPPMRRTEADTDLERRLREIEAELRRLRPAAARPED